MNGSIKTVALPHVRVSPSALHLWPAASYEAAKLIMNRYGLPNAASPNRLVWYYNSPWKRTVVWRNGKPHSVPYPHTDVLEQTVEYRVPPQRLSELNEFSSGVTANPVQDELTAHCDSEHANKMLLNLAHDILIGHRTAKEAQDMMYSLSGALRMNWPEQYAEELSFDWNDTLTDSVRQTGSQ